MYPLGTITSLSVDKLTVNGSSTTYFSVLSEGDEVILNEQTVEVDTVYSDSKFTVKTAFTSGSSGDTIYSVSKCVWLKYQIWKLELAISNYDINLLGVNTARNGVDELQFNTSKTPLNELISLKKSYEEQLRVCQAEENGESIWIVRRYEYGTL